MKRILISLWLPIAAIIILAFVYGGLSLEDLRIKNQNLEQKQINLEEKISQEQEAIANIQKENTSSKERLEKLQTDLADYRNLTSASKKILGVSVVTTNQKEKVKVETNTITEYLPALTKDQASVIVDGVGSYKVEIEANDTAFSLLEKAASLNGFTTQYSMYEGLGAFITGIAGITPAGNQYWAFYYNGKYSMVGASAQKIYPDDTTFWRLESF